VYQADHLNKPLILLYLYYFLFVRKAVRQAFAMHKSTLFASNDKSFEQFMHGPNIKLTFDA